jgi:hypothetical protein
LLLGSVAIDAGSRAECSSCGVVFNKHNFKRPIDGNKDRVAVCDIGAFEFGSPSITCAGEVVTSSAGNDNLRGSSDRNMIYAFGGNDVVQGLAGDDLVGGVIGNDNIIGGPGNNRFLARKAMTG